MSVENWIWQPDELGMTTLVVTTLLNILCILVVTMRLWTRLQTGTYALDDALMVIALGVFTSCCVFTCVGVYAGLGTVDARLEAWNQSTTTKVSRNAVVPSWYNTDKSNAVHCVIPNNIRLELAFHQILHLLDHAEDHHRKTPPDCCLGVHSHIGN